VPANRREISCAHLPLLFPIEESGKGFRSLLQRLKLSAGIGTNNCLIGQTKYLPASLGSKMLRKFKSEGGQDDFFAHRFS